MSRNDASRLPLYQAVETLYPIDTIDPATMAKSLQAQLGIGTQQFVVDRIVDCIKQSDIEAAHAWDEIGQLIDTHAANSTPQPVTIGQAIA